MLMYEQLWQNEIWLYDCNHIYIADVTFPIGHFSNINNVLISIIFVSPYYKFYECCVLDESH